MTKNTKTMLGVSVALAAVLATLAYYRHLQRVGPMVAAGAIHTCQIIRGGGAECWGGNIEGELGNGKQSLSMPLVAPVSGLPAAAEAIAVGQNHTCAIVRNGAVWCWGANGSGQLGNGATQRSVTPVNTGVTGAVQIVAGDAFSCAVVAGGALRCWGFNGSGVFGDGTRTDSTTPSAAHLSGIRRISSGGNYVCALLSGPEVNCWGDNVFQGLTLANSTTPTPVPGTAGAIDVAASDSSVCALWPDGTVKCWGDNSVGQLGNGSQAANSAAPVVPNLIQPGSGNTPAKAISVGHGTACAVLTSGGVKCWGVNQFGSLGSGGTVPLSTCASAGGSVSCSRQPVLLPGIANAVGISSGRNHSCALLADDRVKCWGLSNFGQVGNGSVGGFAEAFPQSGLPAFVARRNVAIGGGGSTAFSCALAANGTIKCWGDNTRGQLGTGTTNVQSTTPAAVSGITDGFELLAGSSHACARVVAPFAANGALRCWGANGFGQLGIGTAAGPQSCGTVPCSTSPTSAAVPVADIAAVGVGSASACAVRSGFGTGSGPELFCWGLNADGQLGIAAAGMPACGPASQPCSPLPRLVPFVETASLSGGRAHACGVLQNGSVMCWGANNEDQLGRAGAGGPAASTVAGIATAVAVASGSDHTCALLTNGTVNCWGRNRFGQLGNGSMQRSSTPVAVQGIQGAVSITASAENTCALLMDGSVRCWGDNGSGQLGIGAATAPEQCQGALGTISTRPCATTPVAVPGISTAVGLKAADNHVCAVLYDGRIQCWGQNARGELGRATTGSAGLSPGDVAGL